MFRVSRAIFLRDLSAFVGCIDCFGRVVHEIKADYSEKTRNFLAPASRSLDRVDHVRGSARDVTGPGPSSEEMDAMGFLDSRQCGSPDRRGQEGLRRRGNARVPSVEDLESRTLLDASTSNLLPIGTPPAPGPTLSPQDVQTILQRAAR